MQSSLEGFVTHSNETSKLVDGGQATTQQQAVTAAMLVTPVWQECAYCALVMLACTCVAIALSAYSHKLDLIMIYMVGVVYVATKYSPAAAYFTCLVSVILFDLIFILPRGQTLLFDRNSLITTGVMLLVTLVISRMSVRARKEGAAAIERERQTQLIYKMSRDLASTRGVTDLASVTGRHIRQSFGARTLVLVPDDDGMLEVANQELVTREQMERAKECYEKKSMQLCNDSQSSSAGIYMPLNAASSTVGVLALLGADCLSIATEQRRTLETLVNQAALAIERAISWDMAERRKMKMETVKVRNALLSSVSHDLRTPLAAIMGAASLLKDADKVELQTAHELARSIYDEADRLNRFLKNLLDMTRLESGSIKLNKQWNSIEESVGAALNRLKPQLAPFKVVTRIPEDLPLVLMDELLIEQVLMNLLDNAAKYGTANSEIEVTATPQDASLVISVANQGVGFEEGEEKKIFDKFYRARSGGTVSGTGLGLTICRGIVQVHGGIIWAERLEHGAKFCFSLPMTEKPPSILEEEEKS